MAGERGIRVIPFTRGSGAALDMLRRGEVHAAGLHLFPDTGGNADRVREALGPGFRLVHVARWSEGIAFHPAAAPARTGARELARLRWVAREPGSGARQCMEEVLEGRRPDAGWDRVARDHRGVVETVRTGWAEAGVCVRLTAEDGGLPFVPVREEAYDLCFPESASDDPRIVALLDQVRSTAFRRGLGELPGYDTTDTGSLA